MISLLDGNLKQVSERGCVCLCVVRMCKNAVCFRVPSYVNQNDKFHKQEMTGNRKYHKQEMHDGTCKVYLPNKFFIGWCSIVAKGLLNRRLLVQAP